MPNELHSTFALTKAATILLPAPMSKKKSFLNQEKGGSTNLSTIFIILPLVSSPSVGAPLHQ